VVEVADHAAHIAGEAQRVATVNQTTVVQPIETKLYIMIVNTLLRLTRPP
jgi:hypothetical protein